MDAVEWWEGRDVRLMRVITVVNEVFNEEMLSMGRVRSDEVITAEDLMLQKTIHEMDFADWLKWVQLVCDAPPASGDEVRRVRCNMLRSKMGGCGVRTTSFCDVETDTTVCGNDDIPAS